MWRKWTLWTFIHIAFKMDIFTQIWKNWWQNSWKFTKCLLYATIVFCWGNFDSWHPKTHGPRNYLHSFYLAALIQKCREKDLYPYAEIRNLTAGRRTRSFQKENHNNGNSSSSSDDEFTPKYKKSYGVNINANFNAFMDRIVIRWNWTLIFWC